MDKLTIQESLVNYFNTYTAETGDGSYTRFRMHIESILKQHVKPLSTYSGMSYPTVSTGDGSWRSDVKSRFGGRGKKWWKVSLDTIQPTINKLQSMGIDCDQYLSWVNYQGFAWIRYDSPRVHCGTQCAAFHCKIDGSTSLATEKALFHVYIPVDQLDDVITPLHGTPHALQLEVIRGDVKVEVKTPKPKKEEIEEELDDMYVPPNYDWDATAEIIAKDLEEEIEEEIIEEEGEDIYEV